MKHTSETIRCLHLSMTPYMLLFALPCYFQSEILPAHDMPPFNCVCARTLCTCRFSAYVIGSVISDWQERLRKVISRNSLQFTITFYSANEE